MSTANSYRLSKLTAFISLDDEVYYAAVYQNSAGHTHVTVVTADEFHDLLLEAQNNAPQPMNDEGEDYE